MGLGCGRMGTQKSITYFEWSWGFVRNFAAGRIARIRSRTRNWPHRTHSHLHSTDTHADDKSAPECDTCSHQRSAFSNCTFTRAALTDRIFALSTPASRSGRVTCISSIVDGVDGVDAVALRASLIYSAAHAVHAGFPPAAELLLETGKTQF